MSESHADRMEGELQACRELFKEAQLNSDSARMISLARIIEMFERNIEKARAREGSYLTQEQISEWEDAFTIRFIEIAKRYIPADKWNALVDELLG